MQVTVEDKAEYIELELSCGILHPLVRSRLQSKEALERCGEKKPCLLDLRL